MGKEQAIDRYISYQMQIRETLESIENKLTDSASPEEINWGHVGWISDLAAKLKEIDENF